MRTRPTLDSATDQPRGLEQALRLFGDVRSGEGPLVLILTLNVFLLLTAYYVIKPVREALILALASGAEYKSYLSAAIAIALLAAVPAYSRLVDRLPRLRLVVSVTLFFASHLVLFYVASRFDALLKPLALVFYVWIGCFNMMVVAQLWSFATDLLDTERGKRLFPLIALGASIGAAGGSEIAALLVQPFGVPALLLVSAAILCGCAALFVAAERSARRLSARVTAGVSAPEIPRPPDRSGAFGLVFQHRYLLAIALFTLVFNWANSNGEYMLGRLVKASASAALARGELAPGDVGTFIGHAYAQFFFQVNVAGVLLQAFLVSRIVKHGGLRVALFVLPVIALGSGLAGVAAPLLAVVRTGKTLENATDYSLNNTVRQLLWLPTTHAMKYKAKQAVDTFFVRLGDVSSALLVYVGVGLCAFSVRGFAAMNAALACIWLVLAAIILREHSKLHGQGEVPEHGKLRVDGEVRGRGELGSAETTFSAPAEAPAPAPASETATARA